METTSLPIGITLPLELGNAGYFQQSFDTLTQIKSNIHNWFLTMRGERPMNPTFGTELYNEIFKNDDIENTNEVCENIIRKEISQKFPNIQIREIFFERFTEQDGEYIYAVKIYLSFNLIYGLIEQDSMEILLYNLS